MDVGKEKSIFIGHMINQPVRWVNNNLLYKPDEKTRVAWSSVPRHDRIKCD